MGRWNLVGLLKQQLLDGQLYLLGSLPGPAEFHQPYLGERVVLAQVTVNAHRQGAAVLVAQPPADGGNVHARLHAGSGEKMAEIVVSKLREFQFPASRMQAFFGVVDFADGIGRLWPSVCLQPP